MQFTVRYRDEVARHAVNTFFKRRLLIGFGRLGLIAIAVSVLALGFLLLRGDRSWFVGLLGAVLLFGAALLAAVWRWRHHEMRRKLAAIPSRKGVVTLEDSTISIATEAGTVSLPWDRFTEVWKLKDCWLLFVAPNDFLTLPVENIPADVLSFLVRKLPSGVTRRPMT